MSKWMLLRRGADFNEIGKKYGIDPLIARIMVNRGICSDEEIDRFLNGDRAYFHDPKLLKDLEKAANILFKKIEEGKKIRVIGDYDGDGVCSTTILLKGLRFLGADVDGIIPHRIKDGYGLNDRLIDNASNDGIDTIVTCDNGISAYKEVKKAKELGMTVIITDHHEVPKDEDGKPVIPPADSVTDPKQEDCKYPYKNICGAFVAYKLIVYMLSQVENDTKYIKEDIESLNEELMAFAAFATITDIMELMDENRCLVKEGLKLIKNTKSTGLTALLEVVGLYGQDITTYHLGFVLGPCVNAAGRIGSADKALNLFMTEDRNEALTLAGDLKAMNDSRKSLTEKATEDAKRIIEETDIKDDNVLVIYLEDCHESVAGIVAGRIKEEYFKPTLVITDSEGVLKGSARSIPSYDMFQELSEISDVFIKFGGHPQAAGFSLEKDKLEELRRRLNENCCLTEDELISRLSIDADAPFSYCTDRFVEGLSVLEPCGNGNPSPVFARKNLKLKAAKIFGSGKVGKYTVEDTDGKIAELTLFRRNEELRSMLEAKYGKDKVDNLYKGGASGITISAAYYPNFNEYNGRRTVQFIVNDFC